MARVKIVVVGETTTGKSTLAHRVAHPRIGANVEEKWNDPNPIPTQRTTVHCDVSTFRIQTARHGTVQCDLVDTAGGLLYRNIVPQQYRDADVVLILVKCDSIADIEKATEWAAMAREHVGETTPVLLAWNRVDLMDGIREKDSGMYTLLMQEMNEQCEHLQTAYNVRVLGGISAMYGTGVQKCIIALIDAACQRVVQIDADAAELQPIRRTARVGNVNLFESPEDIENEESCRSCC
jgi:small GTP-binding protein